MYWCEKAKKHICVSDLHDMTLAVKVALNPNTTIQPTLRKAIIMIDAKGSTLSRSNIELSRINCLKVNAIKRNLFDRRKWMTWNAFRTIFSGQEPGICDLKMKEFHQLTFSKQAQVLISPFPTMFSTHLESFLLFSSISNVLSANSFSLDGCKICCLGKG